MERLDFTEVSSYNPIEAAIHLNRYLTAKQYVAGKRVLDIACGEGYGSRLMKNWGAASVVGVDVSEEALAVANRYFSGEGITFMNHTAEELPFENDSFDVIVSFETIEHLDHPERFLQEIARVVRFDGVVLISCPNDPYYSKNDPQFSNPYHKHAFSFFDFQEMSQRYLGKDAAWYFGFGLSGFSTIPMKDIRLPEGPEGLPQKMTELFDHDYPKATALLRSERYLNYWNACYFLGVWGCDADHMEERAVFYPKEVYAAEESPIWTDIERWNKEYERKQRDAEQEQLYAKEYSDKLERECQEYRAKADACQALVCSLERQRNEADDARKHTEAEKEELVSQVAAAKECAEKLEHKCLEYRAKADACQALVCNLERQRNEADDDRKHTEAEKEELVSQVAAAKECTEKLEQKCLEYQEMLEDWERQLHVLRIEKERTSNLLKLAEEEKRLLWQRIDAYDHNIRNLDCDRWKAWDECTVLREELEGLRNAKAVKLVFLFWRIRDKIFRRKK